MEVFDSALSELTADVLSTKSVPHLGLEITQLPGECWIFQPSWSNLRWWSDEIITQGELLHQLVVRCTSHYLHKRALERLLAQDKETAPQAHNELGEYLSKVGDEIGQQLEDACLKLFSFREKIAWLIYEILSATTGLYLPTRRVSFSNVQEELKSITIPADYEPLVSHIRDIVNLMNKEYTRDLFEFRHGFVHRLGAKLDEVQPPLFVQEKRGEWDSIAQGKVRSRYVIHLVSHTWRAFVRATHEFSKLDLTSFGFSLRATRESEANDTNQVDYIHMGVKIQTSYGIMIVRCMKRCSGFFAELSLNCSLNISDRAETQRLVSEVYKNLIEVIPEFEAEKKSGQVRCNIASHPDGAQIVFTFLTLSPNESDNYTIAERAHELAVSQLGNPKTEVMLADFDSAFELAEDFKDWPQDAKESLKKWIKDPAAVTKAIFCHEPNNKHIKYNVVFNKRSDSVGVAGLGGEEVEITRAILSWNEEVNPILANVADQKNQGASYKRSKEQRDQRLNLRHTKQSRRSKHK